MEEKSLETTLIKISVRTAWLIGAALVVGAVWSAMLYNDIMDGQKDILNALTNKSTEFEYEVRAIKKDIVENTDRIKKLEGTN